MESEIYVGTDFNLLSSMLLPKGREQLKGHKKYYKLLLLQKELVTDPRDNGKCEHKTVLLLLTPSSSSINLLDISAKKGYWCIVSEPCFEQYTFLKLIEVSPFFSYDTDEIVFNRVAGAAVERLFKIMSKEISGINRHKYDLVFNCIALILREASKLLTEKYQLNVFNAASDILREFHRLLDEQFSPGFRYPFIIRTTADFAKLLSVDPGYLNSLVKVMTGKDAGELIHYRMIWEANKLLDQPAYSITEIAHRLGFEYLAHFNQFYKKFTGLTPSSYRKKVRV